MVTTSRCVSLGIIIYNGPSGNLYIYALEYILLSFWFSSSSTPFYIPKIKKKEKKKHHSLFLSSNPLYISIMVCKSGFNWRIKSYHNTVLFRPLSPINTLNQVRNQTEINHSKRELIIRVNKTGHARFWSPRTVCTDHWIPSFEIYRSN